MTSATRVCNQCKITKNMTEDFYPNNYGYKNICKRCENAKRVEVLKQKRHQLREQNPKMTVYERAYNELSEEIKTAIKKDIQEYKISLKAVQRKYNYPYNYITKWNNQFISPCC